MQARVAGYLFAAVLVAAHEPLLSCHFGRPLRGRISRSRDRPASSLISNDPLYNRHRIRLNTDNNSLP